MRSVVPLSQNRGDNVDGLLRAFYRAQMPHPWPKPPETSSQTLPFRRFSRGQGATRSRWVLAASVAFLLAGSLLLPRRFTSQERPEPGIEALGTANRNILPDAPKMKTNEGKPVEKKQLPGLGFDEGELLPDLDDTGLFPPK